MERDWRIFAKDAKHGVAGNGKEVLIDYSSGPHELRNVAQSGSYAKVLDEMRVMLLKKVSSACDSLPERIRSY